MTLQIVSRTEKPAPVELDPTEPPGDDEDTQIRPHFTPAVGRYIHKTGNWPKLWSVPTDPEP